MTALMLSLILAGAEDGGGEGGELGHSFRDRRNVIFKAGSH